MPSGPKYFKTSGHLLVCQGPNCQARGSVLLYKALWKHLESASLAYYKTGGSIRLSESGCLGSCSYGPSLCVYRQTQEGLEEGWFAAVDFPQAARLAQAVHDGAALPDEGKYGPE
ncbi:(2Fe-2S) ferredoxin domain-containing protein [Deinococcus marmoris]|uniref:(2Fe-2S) ferredoxin domain-containing protein n=1 Tax=Deinococcus marmoris TaxID=249408 RepID=UPI00096A300A|nr:(2Fe-2S) ferredoxin domain-containing protein [Deinococcus marmoris]